MLKKIIYLLLPLGLFAQNQILNFSKGTYLESYRPQDNITLDGLTFDLASQELTVINDTAGIDEDHEEGDGIRWLSLDPLAKKYPSISPYHFSGNSPIMFKDPDGKQITLFYVENDKIITHVYKYGDVYEGTNKFMIEVHASLNKLIENSSSAAATIQDLATLNEGFDGEFNVNLHEGVNLGDNSFTPNEGGGTLVWNPYSSMPTDHADPISKKNISGIQSSFIGLIHELFHAESSKNKTNLGEQQVTNKETDVVKQINDKLNTNEGHRDEYKTLPPIKTINSTSSAPDSNYKGATRDTKTTSDKATYTGKTPTFESKKPDEKK